MVKACAITHDGLASFCAEEIMELIGAACTLCRGIVFFEASWNDLAVLCYRAQTVSKVLAVLGEWTSREYDAILGAVERLDIDPAPFKGLTFKLHCERKGDHNFSSQDIAAEAGGIIKQKIAADVNLAAPDIPLYLYIHGETCVLGIDCAGIDLSKRDYRIFSHHSTIKSSLAMLLLRIGGYTPDVALLDPFCGSGTIPIEAALYAAKKSPLYYSKDKLAMLRFAFLDSHALRRVLDAQDKKIKAEIAGRIFASDVLLHHVKSTQKNAKIAGVHDLIKASRLEVGWLETKHDEESISLIVTNPPIVSKLHEKEAIKAIEEFYYQAEFILALGGCIVVCTAAPQVHKDLAKKFGLALKNQLQTEQGKLDLDVLVFEKTKKSVSKPQSGAPDRNP